MSNRARLATQHEWSQSNLGQVLAAVSRWIAATHPAFRQFIVTDRYTRCSFLHAPISKSMVDAQARHRSGVAHHSNEPNRCKRSVGWAKARRAVPIIIPPNPDGHVAALLCPSCMLLNLTSGEIQEHPCKTPFSPLFGPFPNTAGSDLCNCQVNSMNIRAWPAIPHEGHHRL